MSREDVKCYYCGGSFKMDTLDLSDIAEGCYQQQEKMRLRCFHCMSAERKQQEIEYLYNRGCSWHENCNGCEGEGACIVSHSAFRGDVQRVLQTHNCTHMQAIEMVLMNWGYSGY